MVSNDKPTLYKYFSFVGKVSFPLTALENFYLPLSFQSLTIICLGVDFFVYILFAFTYFPPMPTFHSLWSVAWTGVLNCLNPPVVHLSWSELLLRRQVRPSHVSMLKIELSGWIPVPCRIKFQNLAGTQRLPPPSWFALFPSLQFLLAP